MPTEKKIRAVEEMTATLSRSSVVIGADYRGLKVEEATALRRALREAGIEILVVKNTLFLRAAEAAGMPGVGELAEGPTAIIFGFDDPLTPIKTVVEYQRQSRNAFQARKAFMDGEVIPAGRLADLAALPPRNVMIAELAGALQSPIMNLVYLLTATLQEFSGLLDARTEQMDTGPAADAASSAGAAEDSQAEAATASADEPAAEAEETAPTAPEGPDGETAGPGDESSTEEEAGEEDGN
jgi:large subunit ribosomal protein L10